MGLILFSFLLTLDDALTRLKEQSYDASLYLIQMKIQQKTYSMGYSNLFPLISSSGSKTTSYPGGYDTYSIRFNFDQNLSIDNWLNGVNTHFKNSETYYTYLDNLSNLMLTAVNDYMDAYVTKRLLDVRKKALKRTGYYKEKIDEMLRLGSASKADLLKAEVSWYQAQIDLERARKAYREALLTLKYLLKIDTSDSLELTAPIPETKVLPLDTLKSIAYRERPDIKALHENLVSLRIDLASNLSSYLPSINFSGSYGYSGSDIPETKDEWDAGDSYSFTLSLSLPLFSGFNRVNNTIIKKLQIQMAEFELEKKKNQIDIEVEDAYYSLKEAEKMLKLARKNLELAKESSEASRLRYELGEASIIELLSGEEDLLNAEYSYESAVKDYIVSIYRLKKVIGRL